MVNPFGPTQTFLPSVLEDAKFPPGWNVTYYDQLTPGIQMIEIGIDEGTRISVMQASDAIADDIQKIYDAGGEPTWTPAGKSWQEYKARAGFDPRTMHMSGDLETNVHNLRHTLHSNYEPKTGMITIAGFDAAFDGTEYVWLHELIGAPMSGIRRPFIVQGMQRALQAVAMTDAMINEVVGKLATEVPPVRVSIAPPEPLGMAYARHKTRMHLGLFALLMWVVPPSRVWAIMGAASDLIAAGTGKMFESRFLSQWITAYAKGMLAAKAGLIATEKQARRKGRGRIWDRRR